MAIDINLQRSECEYRVSLDGGAKWLSGSLRAPPGFPPAPCTATNFTPAADGSVTFGAGQNVYTSFASPRPGQGLSALVARSVDGGRSFPPAVVAMPGGTVGARPSYSRPELAVVAGGGTGGADRIYVAALSGEGPNRPGRVLVARSDDGGATWSDPVNPSPAVPAEPAQEPSEPVVGPDGAVYVAWRSAPPATAPTDPVGTIVVAKSSDDGATWALSNVAPVRGFGPDALGASFPRSSFPRVAIDPRPQALPGTVYVTYMDGSLSPRQDHFIHPDADVGFVRSLDGGVTWSPPLRINDDPRPRGDPAVEGIAQRHPKIAVASNGRVDIVWQDRRHGYRAPTNAHLGNGEARFGDTYYAFSNDRGDTFSPNRRISDKSQNLDVGTDYRSNAYWDFAPALVPLGTDEVLFAWQDSREGNADTDSMDIYSARLRHTGASAGPVAVRRLPELSPPDMSVAVSRLAYQGGVEPVVNVGFTSLPATTVVVVNKSDPGGALAAAVLARANLGPVLASPAAGLTPELTEEVRRLSPVGAFVVGGEALLGSGVVSDLAGAGVPAARILRLAGTSPADTARLVAMRMDRRDDDAIRRGEPAFDAAVVVNPATADAGAVAGLAAAARLPVLFAERDAVPAATTDALRALHITTTWVVGGPGAVNEIVAAGLPGARRLGGADAVSTSQAVLGESRARRLPVNIAYVADAAQPLAAAVLGAAVARNGGLLVLSPNADPAAAEAGLARAGLAGGLDRLVVVRSAGVEGLPGYRMVAADGGVFAFGGARFLGSAGGLRLTRPVVGMARTPSGNGYWLVASDGGVFAFGDAKFLGSAGALRLTRPVVGMAASPSGNGYWLAASDGGVFAFGDARFLGSAGGLRLNKPIVGMARTPSGNGYWLAASDGGVFAFGDATFFGARTGPRLDKSIVGMAASPSGNGYWLAASDGGVFAFGDARFFGSAGGLRLKRPVVGMALAPSGLGYWLSTADGGVFAFGAARFEGSLGAARLNQPVVGITGA